MTPVTVEDRSAAFQMHQHLIAGRFRTYKRIGKGRLGEIFAAVDESYNRLGVQQHLAIQVISRDIASNNRLFNKLSVGYTMLKATAHPNIVEYQSFGRDGKFGFLAMELLEGASLRTVIDNAGTLPEDEVKTVTRGIGEALSLLHVKDILHGNLTASNIFVTDDLDVRILDVVPLDADDAIFRGAAMSEPFGRCTVEDDVYGLACLTYEMLAGKHPFNHSSAGEARVAGLVAEQISSLSERDWQALQRALSFDRADRPSSIAEFVREFGASGTERLRPSLVQASEYEADIYATAPPPRAAVEPAESPATAGMDAVFESAPRPLRRGTAKWPAENKPYPARAVALGMVLVALLAWTWFGQPEEPIVDAIGYVDESMDLGLVVPEEGIIDIPAADPGEPVLADTSAVPVPGPAAEPLAAAEAESAAEESTNVESAVPPDTAAGEALYEQTGTTVAPAEQPVDGEAPQVAVTMDTPTTDDIEPDAASPAPAAEPGRVLVPSSISVSEGDSAARIQLQASGIAAPQLTWWTSDDTAVADRDYIPAKQRMLTAALLADGGMLHIPLINDSVAEPRESFYVSIGKRDDVQHKIEHIATVRVDIIDDDRP